MLRVHEALARTSASISVAMALPLTSCARFEPASPKVARARDQRRQAPRLQAGRRAFNILDATEPALAQQGMVGKAGRGGVG